MGDGTYTINATQTSFEILELIRDEGGLTTTEIADEIDLAKSAVHKHLQTLTDLQYLTRAEYEYSLGLRCYTLGVASRDAHVLFEPAIPAVENLASVTGEHVSIVVVENETAYYLYSCTGQNQQSQTERDGEMVDPYRSTAGHAIVKRSSQTAYTPEKTHPDTRISHEQGITFSIQTGESPQNAIAVPVTGPDEQPIGALEVTGPARRVSGKRLKEDFAGLVISAGAAIEKRVRKNRSESSSK
ncbi:helix-turn-helix domain-containing protein [Halostagnicola sp. A-GB9-2]|uniref:IclR family transcriptional regulator n=1 Tax=Halostagnicola sp. A-GB9-2 TaxID=3048066 RepID=UPI0024C05504|nr:helix-turn-helix domain-containing protein [Halostagnicola sp. A-GB9-2]MDJ1434016.1 helix-turn-helix domain-containing protein [Halostagnicola sp. A-GB9-2]